MQRRLRGLHEFEKPVCMRIPLPASRCARLPSFSLDSGLRFGKSARYRKLPPTDLKGYPFRSRSTGASAGSSIVPAMLGFTEQEQRALVLSTFAGLSTGIGALFAIIRRPNDSLLALLLGTAIGVMLTLSVAEMWVHNALEHGWPSVTAAVALGASLYKVLQPLMPDFDFESKVEEKFGSQQEKLLGGDNGGKPSAAGGKSAAGTAHAAPAGAKAQHAVRRSAPAGRGGSPVQGPGAEGEEGQQEERALAERSVDPPSSAMTRSASHEGTPPQASIQLRPGELLRLGLLMALTMTLHNLPEGMAVGFAAFTSFGPIMAAAIAVHNIPEGVIVAAPVYAATGSRWKAVGIATASGLSEPLGCMLALLVLRPFLSEDLLQYMLAFVGGIMAAVCVLELWPEARKCRSDGRLITGVLLGGAAMGWTLWVGV